VRGDEFVRVGAGDKTAEAGVSLVGQFFMTPFPAPFVYRENIAADIVYAMAFLAMAHQRVAHPEQARAGLAHLRSLADHPYAGAMVDCWGKDERYQTLLREAEALIEGRPRPKK
jgi:hypothetical protein